MDFSYSYNASHDALSLFFGVYFGIIMVFCFAMLLLSIIAHWKLFKKAGYNGWECLIPIYETYIMMKIGKQDTKPIHLLFFLIPIFNIIYALIVQYRFAKAYTDYDAVGILYVLFPTITGIVMAFSDKYQYQNI